MIAVFFVVAALAVPVGPAAATGTGDVIGTVTDGSAPLEGICVTAWSLGKSYLGADTTDASGGYAISGLAAGTSIRIEFEDCTNGVYATEWHDDKLTFMAATTVTVPDGTALDIPAVLEVGGAITGTVTASMDTPDPGDDVPLEGICVTAWYSTNEVAGEATTDASGGYEISPLPSASFKVQFEDCLGSVYQPEWYDDRDSITAAHLVAVSAPATTTGIDAIMDDGGSISGTVTVAGSDPVTPIEGLCVYLSPTDFAFFDNTTTNALGEYTFTALPDDDYYVSFSNCVPRPNYVPEWYDGAAGSGSATPITVAGGADVSGIDADLVVGVTISGTVTDPEGDGLAVCVQFSDEFAVGLGTVVSDSITGDYSLAGLVPGSIKVKFTDCLGGPYVDQWWDGKFDFTSGDFISLSSGQSAENIDAQMVPGGSIDGIVKDEVTGLPLDSVTVRAVDDDNKFVDVFFTGPDGTFSIGGLPTGDYKIWFQAAGIPYLDEWYQDASDFESATLLSVTPGGTVTVEALLEPWGGIAGTVTDEATGTAIGACITVETPGGEIVATGETEPDGTYLVEMLSAGDYRVHFDDCGLAAYAPEYFDSAGPDPVAAALVTVASGQVTTDIDASLVAAGDIGGTVTAALDGALLENICVEAWVGSTSVGSDITGADGTYLIEGLAPVDHTLGFTDCSSSGFISEWHDGARDQGSATPVMVESSAVTTVDADLDRGGRLSGFIRGADPEDTTPPISSIKLSDIEVALYEIGSGVPAATGITGSGGSLLGYYQIDGIAPGDYEIVFRDLRDPTLYLTEWWNNAGERSGATTFTIQSLADAAFGNFAEPTLALGGVVGGTITDAGTGQPIPGATVALTDTTTLETIDSTTDALGAYELRSLDGTYTVSFAHPDYRTQWHDGATSEDDATPVAAPAGSSTTLDAGLVPASSLSGTVSGSTGPLSLALVKVWDADSLAEVGTALTGFDGGYDIAVGPGDYIVSAFDDGGSGASFHPAASSWLGATVIPVAAGEAITGADVTFATHGTLAGVVTETGSDAPLGDFCVDLATPHGTISVNTNDLGEFAISGLDGVFDVLVSDCGFVTHRTASLVDVAVAAGSSRSLEIALEPLPSGRIIGTVDDGIDPLGSVFVYAHDVGSPDVVGAGITDGLGNYEIAGLDPGEYDVLFVDFANPGPPRAAAWHEGAPTRNAATAVVVGTSAVTIDASLGEGGALAGTVTDGSNPIQFAFVEVLDTSGTLIKSTFSAADGGYTVAGLAGTYSMRFSAPGHLTDTTGFLTVTPPATTAVDAVLTPRDPTVISGVVSGPAGALPDICVELFAAGESVGFTATDLTGAFALDDLEPGSYTVLFDDCLGLPGFASEYFDDSPTQGTAAGIPVTPGSTTTGVDATLERLSRPATSLDSYEADAADQITGNVLANDSGTRLTAQLLTPPNDGALTLEANGDFTYEPYPGTTGIDTFVYVAVAAGAVVSGPVTVTLDRYTTWDESLSGDFTGDGKTDVAMYDEWTGSWQVGASAGTTVSFSAWSDVPIFGWDAALVGDYNGDGKDDLAMYVNATGYWWVALSDGSGFTTTDWSRFTASIQISSQYVGDFNGDGLDDVANFEVTTGKWWVSLSLPGQDKFGTSTWSKFTASLELPVQLIGDINGDGFDDLANYHLDSGKWFLSLSDGSGKFLTYIGADFADGREFFNQFIGDFNGDGKDDLASYDNVSGEWLISMSQGTSLAAPVQWSRFTSSIVITDQFVGDFNGDGNADVANFEVTTGKWWMSLGAPAQGRFLTSTWSKFTPSLVLNPQLIGDLNGDGMDDLINYLPASTRWFGSISNGVKFLTYILGDA